ncbi:MAG: hypothetical protein BWY82_00975 [Verrucomicrobia bacterium ADurb.Bin474]|nr:MAG: hypothetical protein BWY82_00975 [Verrucomicrobia bacterium ADurb.Bin474]
MECIEIAISLSNLSLDLDDRLVVANQRLINRTDFTGVLGLGYRLEIAHCDLFLKLHREFIPPHEINTKDAIVTYEEASKPYQHNGPADDESGNPEFHEIESSVSQKRESEDPVHFQSFYQHLQNQPAHDEGAKQRATDTDR